jgi:hypothetical protein
VNGTWTGTCFLGCSTTFTGDFESDPSGNFKFSYSTCGGPVLAQGRIETSQDGQIIVKDVSPGDIHGELKTDTFPVKFASGTLKVWTLIQCMRIISVLHSNFSLTILSESATTTNF